MICNPHQIFLGEQVKGDEMGGACVCVGEKRNGYMVWWGNLKERDHLEDLGLDGRILKPIYLAQE